MVLTKVLDGVRVTKFLSEMYGKMVLTQDVAIRGIQYDSRKVQPGELFVAIRGTALDGHRFIDIAIAHGAVAVVLENDAALPDALFQHTNVIKIVVPDSRRALATISANYFGHPAHRLRMIGVTGTNGKTTTTHLIKSILEADGAMVGLIGTIEYRVGAEVIPATHTTPESLELNRLLADMVTRGCSSVVMEVSSHALAMNRIDGGDFRAGVFTNLTQDHLDYHGSMEEYFRAKRILFDTLGSGAVAVTNVDDPYGLRMVEGTRASKLTYGIEAEGDITARGLHVDVHGLRMNVHHGDAVYEVRSGLTGRFNAANILAACSAAVALGIKWETIIGGVGRLATVRGRFEQVVSPEGWTAIVDYAHTPDALEHCLRAIRDILPASGGGRIITVFGCGGNRDAGKRPIMGRIATTMSNITIVTSDNPRHEDPDDIIRQIVSGAVPGSAVEVEADRRAAIRKALRMASRGDVVLIAGKGHEDYQVLGDRKIHFDDVEEVRTFMGGKG